jgi:hypothetical protein
MSHIRIDMSVIQCKVDLSTDKKVNLVCMGSNLKNSSLSTISHLFPTPIFNLVQKYFNQVLQEHVQGDTLAPPPLS